MLPVLGDRFQAREHRPSGWTRKAEKHPCSSNSCFVVLYCNFRSLAFLGFIGFFIKAAKSLIYSYPPECGRACIHDFTDKSMRVAHVPYYVYIFIALHTYIYFTGLYVCIHVYIYTYIYIYTYVSSVCVRVGFAHQARSPLSPCRVRFRFLKFGSSRQRHVTAAQGSSGRRLICSGFIGFIMGFIGLRIWGL